MTGLAAARSEPTGARISGIGAYVPRRVVTNDEVAAEVGVTSDWIRGRTGIERRHHAGDGESIADMAFIAGERALGDAGVSTQDIGLVVLASATRGRPMPGGAPEIAARLGIPCPGAFDVNAVCAGFTYALSSACDAIRLGHADHALVIGAERLSDWITRDSPDTYPIFADGAGAAVISRADRLDIGPVVWGSDGDRRHVLGIPQDPPYITMDGPLIYKWASATVPEVGRRACERAGVALTDIDWLVPHQANGRIIRTVAAALGVPAERVAGDVVDHGNTSAASIPLALSELRAGGRVRTGDLALLLGFGAGLTYAGQVVRLP
jgi:3-oxoacyl-[acyl-carrier-protein] synthase-3